MKIKKSKLNDSATVIKSLNYRCSRIETASATCNRFLFQQLFKDKLIYQLSQMVSSDQRWSNQPDRYILLFCFFRNGLLEAIMIGSKLVKSSTITTFILSFTIRAFVISIQSFY